MPLSLTTSLYVYVLLLIIAEKLDTSVLDQTIDDKGCPLATHTISIVLPCGIAEFIGGYWTIVDGSKNNRHN